MSYRSRLVFFTMTAAMLVNLATSCSKSTDGRESSGVSDTPPVDSSSDSQFSQEQNGRIGQVITGTNLNQVLSYSAATADCVKRSGVADLGFDCFTSNVTKSGLKRVTKREPGLSFSWVIPSSVADSVNCGPSGLVNVHELHCSVLGALTSSFQIGLRLSKGTEQKTLPSAFIDFDRGNTSSFSTATNYLIYLLPTSGYFGVNGFDLLCQEALDKGPPINRATYTKARAFIFGSTAISEVNKSAGALLQTTKNNGVNTSIVSLQASPRDFLESITSIQIGVDGDVSGFTIPGATVIWTGAKIGTQSLSFEEGSTCNHWQDSNQSGATGTVGAKDSGRLVSSVSTNLTYCSSQGAVYCIAWP